MNPQELNQQPSYSPGTLPDANAQQPPQNMSNAGAVNAPGVFDVNQAQPYAQTVQPNPTVSPSTNAVPKSVLKSNPNSTQNTLQIAEIRDGIVILNDGTYRSVVMVKSINFDLMSQQEQEAIEYSYQGFLNSLYFPVQIFIRSQKVDLQPYIEKLDKIRTEHDNMLLALLMDDYIGYIDALSQQTNIMDKKFYIVVPYLPYQEDIKPLTQSKNFFSGVGALFNSKEQHVVINEADLEKAKSELRNRIQAIMDGLR